MDFIMINNIYIHLYSHCYSYGYRRPKKAYKAKKATNYAAYWVVS